MSILLSVEVESGKICPYDFTKSDSRMLFEYILECRAEIGNFPNVLGQIEKRFNLNLEPLEKIGGQDFSLEDFGMDEEAFKKAEEENLISWQEPQAFIDCIQSVLSILENNPNIYSTLRVTDQYFTENIFLQDLSDLLEMFKWAKDNKEKKARLVAA